MSLIKLHGKSNSEVFINPAAIRNADIDRDITRVFYEAAQRPGYFRVTESLDQLRSLANKALGKTALIEVRNTLGSPVVINGDVIAAVEHTPGHPVVKAEILFRIPLHTSERDDIRTLQVQETPDEIARLFAPVPG